MTDISIISTEQPKFEGSNWCKLNKLNHHAKGVVHELRHDQTITSPLYHLEQNHVLYVLVVCSVKAFYQHYRTQTRKQNMRYL